MTSAEKIRVVLADADGPSEAAVPAVLVVIGDAMREGKQIPERLLAWMRSLTSEALIAATLLLTAEVVGWRLPPTFNASESLPALLRRRDEIASFAVASASADCGRIARGQAVELALVRLDRELNHFDRALAGIATTAEVEAALGDRAALRDTGWRRRLAQEPSDADIDVWVLCGKGEARVRGCADANPTFAERVTARVAEALDHLHVDATRSVSAAALAWYLGRLRAASADCAACASDTNKRCAEHEAWRTCAACAHGYASADGPCGACS